MLCGTSAFKSALRQLVFVRDTVIYTNIHTATDKKNRHFSSRQIVILVEKVLSFFVMKKLKF